MQKYNFFKKKSQQLTTGDKAIISTILKSLNISSHDNILELSKNGILSSNDVFKNTGCYVKWSDNLNSLDGGMFQYIFIFNMPYRDISFALTHCEKHLDNGKIVILNTTTKLSQTELTNISNVINNSTKIDNENFSLIIG